VVPAYEKPESLVDCAIRLADLGYWPVPIPHGHKGPIIAGWQALRLNFETVPDHFKDAGLIGILHTNVLALDIDVYDEDLSRELADEAFRRWPGALERIGEAPKTAAFLRMEEPGFKIPATVKAERTDESATAQVDVRSVSRQIVVYGKHPSTGMPYRWPRGELWATPWGDLPEAKREDVQDFRDWCDERIRTWAGMPRDNVYKLDDHPRRRDDEAPSEGAFLEALSYIPSDCAYDDWLRGLMAIHEFYGGSGGGLSRAHEWSSSYAHYSRREVDQKWRSFESSSYAHYSRREVDQKWRSFEVGRGVSHRTIFHMARQNGADLSEIARKHKPRPSERDARDAPDLSDFDVPTANTGVKEEKGASEGFSPFDTSPLSLADLTDLAPRRWLYGRKLLRAFCSVLAAPGGLGKSAWVAAVATDLAEGRNTLHDEPNTATKVWIYNLEDPREETLRKIEAIRRAKGVSLDGLGNLIVSSGRDRSLIVAEEVERGVYVATPDVPGMIDACKAAGVGCLIVDPAVRAHRLPENDNKAIDLMMDQFARIAHEADISVLLVHHTKKGFVAGEADSFRGASSMTSAARVALTMQVMSPQEATEMSIGEDERRRLVRIDNAKSNLAPPAYKTEWVKLESQNLDNGTEDYPDGDNVQVVTKWEPPTPWEGIGEKLEEIFDRIERGYIDPESGQPLHWRPTRQGKEQWVGNAVMASFGEEKTISQCASIIAYWKEKGFIEIKKARCPKTRHERDAVFVVNRPKTEGENED